MDSNDLTRLADYLQQAVEEERARLARQIHDDLGQLLTALKMDVAWLSRRVEDEAVRARCASMAQLLDAGIQRVRRLSVELRPGMLDDLGLVPALEWLAEEFTAHSGVPCHMAVSDLLPELDDPLRTTLYRVAQEALTNAARHAGATQVWLTLQEADGWVRLQVQDDGRGITPEEVASPHALGLLGMRERVRARGGVLEISGRPGQGTLLTVRAPLRPTSPPGEKPSGAETTTE